MFARALQAGIAPAIQRVAGAPLAPTDNLPRRQPA